MKVLVCGDRNWSDVERIRRRLIQLPEDTTIIHGGARGADSIAGQVAEELHMPVIEVRADWKMHGLAAGPIRNRQMLDLDPDLVLYAHDDLAHSRGTRNCILQARNRGISIEQIP